MRAGPVLLSACLATATVFILAVPDWQRPLPSHEIGYRALAMDYFEAQGLGDGALDHLPDPVPAGEPDARPANEAFHNVQVLTELDAGQFLRLQRAMTAWVAPQQGCGFCHTGTDYASDDNPRKQAARTMLRMTRRVNADWQDHVGATGVTCYSCHRGQPVPPEVWRPLPPQHPVAQVASQEHWNETARSVRDFFPDAGWSEYLLQETPGLVQARTSLSPAGVGSQIETKRLYEMMMQMSDGIGVGCVYCHNSRAFTDWSQSTPARWTGYSGIRLTRTLNQDYLLPLAQTLPQLRDGPAVPLGPNMPARPDRWLVGNGLVVCATCHAGLPKPLHGADLLADYPGLRGAPH